MEPDVAPLPDRETVAEPLMGQFVRDEAFARTPSGAMIGPENGEPLRLDRNLEVVVSDDDGVVGERVRAEEIRRCADRTLERTL